jgi:glycosyltransferase involved in cell wall biosynthesis
MSKGKFISLVIPTFNEDLDTLSSLESEINTLILSNLEEKFEIILIDDSTKTTCRSAVKNMCITNGWKGVFFTRNFGKEAAIRAGLEKSHGDAVIILDADLQDPISLIPKMIATWQDLDTLVVLAKRIDRRADSFLKRKLSGFFYMVINKLSDVHIPTNVGDFRLIDKKVVESVLKLNERNIFMNGIFAWTGYPTVTLEYVRPARENGDSKFPFRRLLRIATDGIVSFSSLPLRLWSYLGVLIAIGNTVFMLYIIAMKLTGQIQDSGYASLIVVSTFTLSMNLICFGIFGEYISRMFLEVKARPHYLILEETN